MGNEGVTTGQEYKKRGRQGLDKTTPFGNAITEEVRYIVPNILLPTSRYKTRYPTHCRSSALPAKLGARSPATLTGRG